jgi:hypothetical protein
MHFLQEHLQQFCCHFKVLLFSLTYFRDTHTKFLAFFVIFHFFINGFTDILGNLLKIKKVLEQKFVV